MSANTQCSLHRTFRSLWLLLASLLALVLCVSCGGGGGADGTGTGTAPSVGSATGTPSIDTDALTFTAYLNGTIPEAQMVNARLRGDRLVMSPRSDSFPQWLRVVKNPNIGGRNRRYTFSIATIDMAPGTYTQTITLRDEEDTLIGDELIGSLSFPVTLHILDEIHLSQDTLTFKSAQGASLNPVSQKIEVSGTTASWSATSPDAWIDVVTTNGTGAGELEIGVDLAGVALPAGIHTGTVTVTDNGSGASANLVITARIEPRRISVIDNGLAFTSYPGGGRLTNTVVITDNGSQDTVWQLDNNVSWLTANRSSGKAGDALILNANITGLAPGVHTGMVTVSSGDALVNNIEEIAVGLFVSDSVPADSIEASGVATGSPVDMVADPIRPYVYAVTADEDIRVIHLYTGEEVTTVSVTGANLRALAITGDGSALFAANAADYSIVEVDLSSYATRATFTGDFFDVCENCSDFQFMRHYLGLEYTRTNGQPLLVTSGHKVLDANDGGILYDFDAMLSEDLFCCDHDPSVLAASADGSSIFLQEQGVSSHSLVKLDLDHSLIESEPFKVLLDTRIYEDGNARDLAIDHTGTTVCTASAGEHQAHCYAAKDLTPIESYDAGNGYMSNVEFDMNGNLFVGTDISSTADFDVQQHDRTPAGTPIQYSVSGSVRERFIVTSSDGLRLVVRSQGGQYITSLKIQEN